MKRIQKLKYRLKERGNVLFLILIAVALFAALSYAVTSSTRTGSGTADGETNLINSAQVTQYPASVRTAVVRMLINGVSAEDLEFNGPREYGDLTDVGGTGKFSYGVFHPDGGGATLVAAPPEVMENQQPGIWGFNSLYQVENVGTTDPASPTANDIVAFLPGVTKAACRRLNEELGITAASIPAADWADTDNDGAPNSGIALAEIPIVGDIADVSTTMDMLAPASGGESGITTAATAAHTITKAFKGQAYGCFDANDGTATPGKYVYYHVLLDR